MNEKKGRYAIEQAVEEEGKEYKTGKKQKTKKTKMAVVAGCQTIDSAKWSADQRQQIIDKVGHRFDAESEGDENDVAEE
ncbi:unnamed protein product [Nippostrongylus brasiliensis]|uniref:Uncharacterized protein n=1 Tax=Nippostrongylus brasiliensis TaxID=27835 RepID=A0A0N4XEM2_NIPBR|nr:unnamed protein product [Nippostrongylus brasiliensis]